MSQEELAKICGLSQSSVSRYLKGERLPDLEAAVALARGLACNLEWLAGTAESDRAVSVSGTDYIRLPERDPRPLNPPERAALEKALVVLRAQGARGDPDVALFSNIECFYQNVEAAGLGAQRGVRQPVEGRGTASSAKRNSAR